MDRTIRDAIARIEVMQGTASASRGTGTLVTANLVLTALHVVADRRSDPPTPIDGRIVLQFGKHTTDAEIVAGRWDRSADWVLLRCVSPPPHVLPVRLTRLSRSGQPWETFGFPDANPRDGMVQSGRVDAHEFGFDGVPAFQLFSEHAAAGGGAPVKGLSGAPVVVGDGVVGLLRFALMQDNRAVAGTLYACPAATVTAACEGLLTLHEPVERMSTSTAALRETRSIKRIGLIALALALLVPLGLWRAGVFSRGGTSTIAGQLFKTQSSDALESEFSAGLCQAILDKVGSIAALSVPRRSCVTDASADGTAGTIIDGSMHLDGDSLHLDVRLATAEGAKSLWSHRYNVLIADNASVGDSIALAVGDRLNVAITSTDRARMEARIMTTNARAQQFYSQGIESYRRAPYSLPDAVNAAAMSDSAVALDTTFAEAQALRSQAHATLYFGGMAPREQHAQVAESAARRALTLRSYLPDAHTALGVYFYRVRLDYDSALFHLRMAHRLQAGNGQLKELIGSAERRAGQWDSAALHFKHASDLNRGDAEYAYTAGQTFLFTHRYKDAAVYADRSIGLMTDTTTLVNYAYHGRAMVHVVGAGRVDSARLVLAAAREAWGFARPFRELTLREFRPLIRLLDRETLAMYAPLSLRAVAADSASYYLAKGAVLTALGRTEASRRTYDSARVVLEGRLRTNAARAAPIWHSDLAVAYAGAGRADDAVREGKLSVSVLPIDRDAYGGMMQLWYLTEIYLMLGKTADARSLAVQQLAIPGYLSVAWIRADPLFGSLASDARLMATAGAGR